MDGWMDGWMDRWTDGRMDGWMDGRMDGHHEGRKNGRTVGRLGVTDASAMQTLLISAKRTGAYLNENTLHLYNVYVDR